MTLDIDSESFLEVIEKVCKTENKYPPGQFIIDWSGSGRGGGKRINGQVLGSMADPPRGVKTYTDPLQNLPDAAEIDPIDRETIRRTYITEKVYLRSRSAGYEHEDSMKILAVFDMPEAFPDQAGVFQKYL